MNSTQEKNTGPRTGAWAGGPGRPPEPGLYFVATPIGAARDITLRALDLLAGADVLVAEDTRSLRHLMDIHGIALGARRLVAYHDHSPPEARARILGALADGQSVVYASEAGTPLVADPGYRLGREAAEAGFRVTAAPGPSAMLAALTVSGLPSDRFLFAGFPPSAAAARRNWLSELTQVAATLILYESPNRIQELLADCVQIFGAARQAALCRELTKKFEEVRRGSLAQIAQSVAETPARGEIVLAIDRPGESVAGDDELRDALGRALRTMRVKEAATMIAASYGRPRRDIYQLALALSTESTAADGDGGPGRAGADETGQEGGG